LAHQKPKIGLPKDKAQTP